VTYDEGVAQLFQVPHAEFVAARKRIAGELKTGGDKQAAARLAKLGRPPISAWAVNQLYWKERESFDALLESAERMKKGERASQAEYREATARLRAKAAEVMEAGGHAANEATLRRVTATLSAIAVAGGFGDGAAGALQEDLDPPGFDAMVGVVIGGGDGGEEDSETGEHERAHAGKEDKEEDKEREREKQDRRKKEEAERAKKAAKKSRLEAALSTARIEAAVRARNVEALKAQLDDAETRVAKADAQVAEIEAELDAVDRGE
jgi:hypothetical protein